MARNQFVGGRMDRSFGTTRVPRRAGRAERSGTEMIAVLPLILGPPLLFHASVAGVHHVATTPPHSNVHGVPR